MNARTIIVIVRRRSCKLWLVLAERGEDCVYFHHSKSSSPFNSNPLHSWISLCRFVIQFAFPFPPRWSRALNNRPTTTTTVFSRSKLSFQSKFYNEWMRNYLIEKSSLTPTFALTVSLSLRSKVYKMIFSKTFLIISTFSVLPLDPLNPIRRGSLYVLCFENKNEKKKYLSRAREELWLTQHITTSNEENRYYKKKISIVHIQNILCFFMSNFCSSLFFRRAEAQFFSCYTNVHVRSFFKVNSS